MKPYTEEQKQEVINLYLAGDTATAIGEDLGRSRDTICKVLKGEGIRLRMGQGWRTPSLSIRQKSELVSRYEGGASVQEIQEEFEIGRTLIFRTLRESDVETRQEKADRRSRFVLGKVNKTCSKCDQLLPITEFYPHKGYQGGYTARCKTCSREYPSRTDQEQRTTTKDERRQRRIATRIRNKKVVWDYFADHPCVECGEGDRIVLELHHLPEYEKLDSVGKLVMNCRSVKVIENEITKCEALCANCHRRKTAIDQNWYQHMQ